MDNNYQRNNNDPNNDRRGGGQPGNKNHSTIVIFLIVTLITLLIMSFVNNMMKDNTSQEITYDQFLTMLSKGQVGSVRIGGSKLTIIPKTQPFSAQGVEFSFYTGRTDDPELVSRLEKAGVEFSEEIPDTTTNLILNVVLSFAPLILIWILLGVVMRRMSGGGGMMGVGKSRAKVYVQKETGVTFADVAGQDEAKESLQEVVDFLEHPGRYTGIGAKLPKGALLVGPPGTGKTLLARAVAGEAHCPFFSLSGSDFVEMFVGVGASRVRDLFEEAKKNSPCIIFIDEIDAIGKSRDNRFGGNDEREQTLNQLLAEMDGFDPSKGILILAATNRPEVLDQALLRPGRFDRRVIVDRPDLKGRVDVLRVHAKNVRMDDTVDLEAIALATSGAVGSDLANMINEAAILAVKKGRKVVCQADLLEAVEVVLVGKEKKDRILGVEERRIVSYHEVGHALISALQKDSEPVQKITIVPRTMGALGYVMNVPEEEKFLNTEKELRAMLVELVGGRAAEEIVFDTITTGAANDIEKATRIARAMVTQYGMSKKFGLVGLESAANQYLDNGQKIMNCSDVTAAGIDDEVMKMLHEAYAEAKRLLSEHRGTMDQIAAFLIEKETITGKEFMEIFHRVEGISPDKGPADAARIHERPSVIELPDNSAKAEQETAAQADAEQETTAQADAEKETGAQTDAAEETTEIQTPAGETDAEETSEEQISAGEDASEETGETDASEE
ncbi:MAG: ATP-dependent zinc metalloprotease FtsH [Lachnospiraceae bacterium]|nr:ATP-dependent zinc metalloprotease FtsH [Lachnospiraceae bacterium]